MKTYQYIKDRMATLMQAMELSYEAFTRTGSSQEEKDEAWDIFQKSDVECKILADVASFMLANGEV